MKNAILFCALIVFIFLMGNTAQAEECYLELRGGVGKWKGPCKDGEAYGTGFATFPNGTYSGSAKDGRAHGRGKMRFQDGIHLEGRIPKWRNPRPTYGERRRGKSHHWRTPNGR